MSWQYYVDEYLMKNGNVSEGGIFGLKDGSPWATSPSFEVKSSDIKEIIAGLRDTNSPLFASGIHVAGIQYLTLKANGRSTYGKKGATGVCIAKAGQCLVIGVYKENIRGGDCANTVENMVGFLLENDY
ncbi:hypothetical protein INT45_007551 [Circinella minor]|uniref:Profilin n=1 Tax=Circinella minor TaxID=1195481 RepID=A0A8H7S3P1_9FUNG|nr:hypothetical protein INT45_007551 [Circinella minor]